MVITNKLTFDPPTRIPELTQNLIRSSHGHSIPSLKMSCKSVQPFSRNVADKETKKQRNNNDNDNDVYFTLATSDSRIGKYKTKKEIARKQYPVPYLGRGNK